MRYESEGVGESRISPFIVILGIAQDGGVPHIGTASAAWDHPELRRHAASIGIVDPATSQLWMIEATPDFSQQLHRLHQFVPQRISSLPLDGLLITHAHIGHYLGLAFLGRETLDVRGLPVHVMPRMAEFLTDNLPWKGLVERGNIEREILEDRTIVQLNERISLMPLLVPHRDEYSETVGFRIILPDQKILFIPDIDRWEDLDARGVSIEEEIAAVDLALLDGTFFSGDELGGRDMKEISHPTIMASMERFAELPEEERKKIHFIHLNHTNPALDTTSEAHALITSNGFAIAEENSTHP